LFDYSKDAAAQRQSEDSSSKEDIKAFVRKVFEHYDVNPSIEESNKKIITENIEYK